MGHLATGGFRLRFAPSRIPRLAAQYTAGQSPAARAEERGIVERVAPAIRATGVIAKPDFMTLGRWKTPRLVPKAGANSAKRVREATRLALAATDETLRIGILLTLQGVGWPMASVLLHFGHRDPYPILDVRALESLGVQPAPAAYSFDFWWSYVTACRALARRARVDMRTLDRALWQWSAERGG